MLKEVMTFKEASTLWGLGESTLRSTIRTDRLIENVDYWKSGSTWLITKKAMIKLYGLTEDMKKINTRELAILFKLIKGKNGKENDFLFKQIKFEIQHMDKELYKEEDLIALCCISVLKKCKWLNLENYNDFKNVSNFVELFVYETIKKPSIRTNAKDFNKLSSIIIGLT